MDQTPRITEYPNRTDWKRDADSRGSETAGGSEEKSGKWRFRHRQEGYPSVQTKGFGPLIHLLVLKGLLQRIQEVGIDLLFAVEAGGIQIRRPLI